MIPASPKKRRGPDLPLDTQRPPPNFMVDDGIDNVESPRTKVSQTFDTLDLDGQTDSIPKPDPLKKSESATHLGDVQDQTSQEDDSTSATAPQVLPRSKSPPLDGQISDKFWHDSEITGHDPTDPTDDGYGINGIGFRPTPALAWSRSQRRKQQLTDLKNREAREARQQRSERRKRFISESDDHSTAMDASPRKNVRVRFENG
ncbi:uncharacterized protein A1O9_04584 [Exophiala aquamarina CBS 119918]|uniref:Uncharacterized protein n=1 Tax=Exophiala aquamarina CBS 119918 TaxID=1182545 RepID=A0A072PK98_9EURO|nr:uncharacterized protein A1O9_04584 [Exophiala aquamarina CBS 119918]KEF59738.1 hypothetical protein A1O9_04584 [Exophiala aquamarina CBS 119918]